VIPAPPALDSTNHRHDGRGPTRIAYVIGELGKGGAEYQLYELVRGLDRTRFAPIVFSRSPAGGYWAGRLRDAGVEVVELPSRRSMEVGRLRELRRRLGAFRPSVLHTVLWSGNAYGRLAAIGLGIPVVITAERNVIRRPAWQRAIERGLDLVTDRYLVNSNAIVDELAGQGGIARGKMQVIHNGIDLATLPPFDPDRAPVRRWASIRAPPGRAGRAPGAAEYPTYCRRRAVAAACRRRFPGRGRRQSTRSCPRGAVGPARVRASSHPERRARAPRRVDVCATSLPNLPKSSSRPWRLARWRWPPTSVGRASSSCPRRARRAGRS
jgi:glycosyltransferase involved in cell wall biosynthesis